MLSIDLDKSVTQTHTLNLPSVPFMNGDLSDPEVKSKLIDKFIDKDIGLIVGGPPCQGFSMFGKRRFINTRDYKPESDPRNKLVFSFIDIVSWVMPRWFIMENCSGSCKFR